MLGPVFGCTEEKMDSLKRHIKKAIKRLANSLRKGGYHRASERLRSLVSSDDEDKLDFFLDLLFKLPSNLRKGLAIDDDGFQRVAGPAHSDCRAYYFYGVCDEIIQAGTAALHWRELLEGPELTKPTTMEDRAITRPVLDRVEDEQNLWQRKLVEHLVNAICFSQYNQQPYYRAFLAAEELEKYLSIKDDFREFFSCDNKNIQELISHCIDIIERIQKENKISQLPFLSQPISRNSLPRPGRVFHSIRKRYKQAIKLSNSEEKLVLRFSYGLGFSSLSSSVHGATLGEPKPWDPRLIEAGMTQVGLIAMNLILRAHQLCGVTPVGLNQQLSRVFPKGSIAPQLIGAIMKRELKPGDIVLANGDLAEVLSMSTSEYGYTSFKVRYLGQPPIPKIVEDEFPARYIKLIIAKENIRSYLEKGLSRASQGKAAWDDIKHLPDEKFHVAMKKTFLELDRRGLLKHLFRPLRRDPGG